MSGNHSSNPRLRAARALVQQAPAERFVDLVRTEPLPLVQRLLVVHRPREYPAQVGIELLLSEGVSLEAKSAVLERYPMEMLSVAPDGLVQVSGGVHRQSEALSALKSYYGLNFESRSLLDSFLRRIRDHDDRTDPADPVSPVAGLARAYATGRDHDLLKIVPVVSESQIRSAINVLSPQNRDGLVSFYWLREAQSELLACYLFFRRVLFFLERSSVAAEAYADVVGHQ